MILATTARDLHEIGAWLVIVANTLAGLWALGAHYKESLARRQLWWFTVVAQVLVFVQATIGVVVQSREDLEPPDFHLLYGFTMIVVVAILYSYRIQIPQYRYLLYAGGGFFLAGMGVRALII